MRIPVDSDAKVIVADSNGSFERYGVPLSNSLIVGLVRQALAAHDDPEETEFVANQSYRRLERSSEPESGRNVVRERLMDNILQT